MKLLLILLLIGLYSCHGQGYACKGPYTVSSAAVSSSSSSDRGKYAYEITDKCSGITNTIYSDSLWSVGDTLKLVKQ